MSSSSSVWRRATDAGQFSLTGAQPKTALLFDGKRWGVPSGAVPTTHILKPGMVNLDGHAHNEHFCLELAGALGLPVARSWVARFEDQARKLKVAMKVGGKYRMHDIGLYQWRKLARDLKLAEEHLVGLVRRLAAEVPDAATEVLRRARRDGLAEASLQRLGKAVSERAKRVGSI